MRFLLGLALLILAGAGLAAPQQSDELLAALAATRSRGCAGQPGTLARLRPSAQLGEAAQYIGRRESPGDATRRAGYRATRIFSASMNGYASPAAVAKTMADKYCNALIDPSLTEIGSYQEGTSYWLVLAAPFSPPPQSAAASVAGRVLTLTNHARSQPRNCGDQFFNASPPLQPNPLLDRAAASHAQEMARHGLLEHEGRDGSSPADRVTRTGYRWRSVGENIASGQTTAEQVVQEWLRSPAHCANLMRPSFLEMGLAYAVNVNSAAGIYWVQELGRPR
jgi:uncharacterized protein YkwD